MCKSTQVNNSNRYLPRTNKTKYYEISAYIKFGTKWFYKDLIKA